MVKGNKNITKKTTSSLVKERAELKLRLAKLNDELGQRPDAPLDDTDELLQQPTSAGTGTMTMPGTGTGTGGSTVNELLAHNKSGYLYKWQDRQIGWGGTKWDLRYAKLEKGKFAYYRSHEDHNPRYVLTLRRCAVRDDGHKPNRRYKSKTDIYDTSNDDDIDDLDNGSGSSLSLNTPNAYFHVFSIYQRPLLSDTTLAQDDDDEDIVPLLRFSTNSLAEKAQWIELLTQACAYASSDEFLEMEKHTAIANNAADPNSASNLNVITNGGRLAPPMKQNHGTLPPMYFAPPPPRRAKAVPNRLQRSESFRKFNTSQDAAKSNSKKRADYPPSKPMHRCTGPSYLSNEAPIQNYRGLLNLMIIILVISNFRLLLQTIQDYGFVFTKVYEKISLSSSKGGEGIQWSDITLVIDYPLVCALALLHVLVHYAYLIELGTSTGKLWGDSFGFFLHFMNASAAMLIPMLIVWYLMDSLINGAFLLMTATITWMKLLSYAHANRDYRTHCSADGGSLKLVKDLDMESQHTTYPQNVTLQGIYYFWFAPTLTYQIAFPKLPHRNWTRICTLFSRIIITSSITMFILSQVISPSLDNLIQDLNEQTSASIFSVNIIVKYLLRLAMASTYVWLLGFYTFFHLYLNLLAELLRFGDRVFYKDWWNSSNVSSYWRLWNLPVHYWLVRHLYFPCIRSGLGKTTAMLMVFFFSAVMHEVLISIPFHMIRPWSFLGMMAQVPLVGITKYFDKVMPGSSIGNITFWMSFCIVGQPMAILMYTIDYWTFFSNETTTECSSLLGVEYCTHVVKSANEI